jgi:uncharacterized protein
VPIPRQPTTAVPLKPSSATFNHTRDRALAETILEHLLAELPPSLEALARLHQDEILQVAFDFETQAAVIWRLLAKYRDVPMDFADACLVRLTELHGDCVLWTTDADFHVYRRHGRQVIPTLCP